MSLEGIQEVCVAEGGNSQIESSAVPAPAVDPLVKRYPILKQFEGLSPEQVAQRFLDPQVHESFFSFITKDFIDFGDARFVPAMLMLVRTAPPLSMLHCGIMMSYLNRHYVPSIAGLNYALDERIRNAEPGNSFGAIDDEHTQSYRARVAGGAKSLLTCHGRAERKPCMELEGNLEKEARAGLSIVLRDSIPGSGYLVKTVVGDWKVLVHLVTGEVFCPTMALKWELCSLQYHVQRPTVGRCTVIDLQDVINRLGGGQNILFSRLLYPPHPDSAPWKQAYELRKEFLAALV